MTTGSEIVGMASFVRKKLMQDMIRIVKYVCEEESFMSAASCDRVGSSIVNKPSRTARRIGASTCCLSAALVKPAWSFE